MRAVLGCFNWEHAFVNWIGIHYGKHKVNHTKTRLNYLQGNLFLYCAIDVKECPKHSNKDQDTCNIEDRLFEYTHQKLYHVRGMGQTITYKGINAMVCIPIF